MKKAMAMVLLFSVVSMSPFFGVATAAGAETGESYERGMDLLDDRSGGTDNIRQAEWIFLEILKGNPKSAPAHVGLARVIYKKGNVREDEYDRKSLGKAIGYITRAIELDPYFFDAYYYGGVAQLYYKDPGKAETMAAQARRIDAASPKTALLDAFIAEYRQNYTRAEELALAVARTGGDSTVHSDALTLLTRIYLGQKKLDEAETAYLQMIELFPESAWPLYDYAEFLVDKRKDYDKAIEYCVKAATTKDPSMGGRVLAKAYYGKGTTELEAGRPETARDSFGKAIEQVPHYPEAYFGIALSHFPGSPEKTTDALLEAIRLNPQYKEARSKLIEVEAMRRNAVVRPRPENKTENELSVVATLKDFGAAQKLYQRKFGRFAPNPELLLGLGAVDREMALSISPALPYRGYWFAGVDRRGRGAMDYRSGFVFIAVPARYGRTGLATFAIGPNGQVLKKDVGAVVIDDANMIGKNWEILP